MTGRENLVTDSIPNAVHNKPAGDNAEQIYKHPACQSAYKAYGYVVMRMCSCAYMGICRYTDMRLYGCVARGYTVKGYVGLWCAVTRHLAVDLFLHPTPVGIGYRFLALLIPISVGH